MSALAAVHARRPSYSHSYDMQLDSGELGPGSPSRSMPRGSSPMRTASPADPAAPPPFTASAAASGAGAGGGAGPSSSPGGGGTILAPASASAALAASRFRIQQRSSYFDRITSGARASTSAPGAGPSADQPPPTPRHSAALAPHPLHPLAKDPLWNAAAGAGGCSGSGGGAKAGTRRGRGDGAASSGGGGGGGSWREEQLVALLAEAEAEGAGDLGYGDEDESDTFWQPASYCPQSLELSSAPSYGNLSAAASFGDLASASAASAGGPPSQQRQGRRAGGSAASAAAGPLLGVGRVRGIAARFGGSARLPTAGSGAEFVDDVVSHVGALLASHPDVEAQVGMVQGLADKLQELQSLCEALERKEDEVEHLRGVLRDLTTSRAVAIQLKVQMAESLNAVQAEYHKVLRSATRAQGAAKQHAARLATTRRQLADASAELERYKRAVLELRHRNRRLRSENEDLSHRLDALESVKLNAGHPRYSQSYMALAMAAAPVLV